MIWLIIMLLAIATISYFVIKDGNSQLNNNDDDYDDPTITCWDDNKAHTEGKI
jgi:hypothetical protein